MYSKDTVWPENLGPVFPLNIEFPLSKEVPFIRKRVFFHWPDKAGRLLLMPRGHAKPPPFRIHHPDIGLRGPGEANTSFLSLDHSLWGKPPPPSKVNVKVTQLCPTLCDRRDYTIRGILQARILEWVACPFSRGSSQPRDPTQVSCIASGFFTS